MHKPERNIFFGSLEGRDFRRFKASFGHERFPWHTSLRAIGFHVDENRNSYNRGRTWNEDFNSYNDEGLVAVFDSTSPDIVVNEALFARILLGLPANCSQSGDMFDVSP